MIIKKSIRKENVKFAHEIFEKMAEYDVIPDDVTYSNLIEELLSTNYQEEAFSLYIHVKYFCNIILCKHYKAYLNNVTLDLEIFISLMEKLKKKESSFLRLGYKILKETLQPSKML